MSQQHRGSCFCGAVEVEATGEPVAMGYCHCESCRHWSAGPLNAFSLWAPDAVRVICGGEELGSYQKTPNSLRRWCKSCGGHVLTEHPEMGLIDVYAALLPDLIFEPALHVHYQEAVLKVADGLPKLRDVPAEMGGTGETLPE